MNIYTIAYSRGKMPAFEESITSKQSSCSNGKRNNSAFEELLSK
jgi:hypothetical protein